VQLEKIQGVRHLLPELGAVVLFDDAVAAKASVLGLADVSRRGHDQINATWGTAKEFRERARRPSGPTRDDHLHVGNDRRAKGRDADAWQPGLESLRR